MLISKTIIFNGVEHTADFYCWTTFHNSGFTHHCNFNIDGYNIFENIRTFWINRTWERYSYATVCKKAVDVAMKNCVDTAKAEYKKTCGYKRLTESHYNDFLLYLNTIEKYNIYKYIYTEL